MNCTELITKQHKELNELEALENEKNEALRRITNYLTPRIRGEIPVSIQEREECEAESKSLSARISEIDTLLTEPQELPEEVAEVVEPILATVDGLPLEVYTRNEDAAILIRCEVEAIVEAEKRLTKQSKQDYSELLERHKKGLSYQNEIEVELADLKETHKETLETIEVVEHLHKQEVIQLTLERDQALLYRDNAAKQLEEMAFELEQNRIELNRNREVRALTEAERTAEQEAARKSWEESRTKVYNMRFEDEYKIDTKWKLANIAETGEIVRYRADYEKGLYEEITEDEALAIQARNKPVETPPLVNEVNEADIFQADTSTEASLPSGEQGTEQQDCGSDEQTVRADAETEIVESDIIESWSNERLTMFIKRHAKRLNRLEEEVYRPTDAELAS